MKVLPRHVYEAPALSPSVPYKDDGYRAWHCTALALKSLLEGSVIYLLHHAK